MYRRTCTSPRWKGFDYSSANLYFVTSCVKRRIPAFGHLENGKMILNEYGKIAHRQWLWLAENFDYVSLHEFVIMPDHMHGIIEIVGGNKIKPLSDLMGAFKTTSSKQIHLAGLSNFKWQRSFHDRVIRNDCELYNIAQYIIRNPSSTSRR